MNNNSDNDNNVIEDDGGAIVEGKVKRVERVRVRVRVRVKVVRVKKKKKKKGGFLLGRERTRGTLCCVDHGMSDFEVVGTKWGGGWVLWVWAGMLLKMDWQNLTAIVFISCHLPRNGNKKINDQGMVLLCVINCKAVISLFLIIRVFL